MPTAKKKKIRGKKNKKQEKKNETPTLTIQQYSGLAGYESTYAPPWKVVDMIRNGNIVPDIYKVLKYADKDASAYRQSLLDRGLISALLGCFSSSDVILCTNDNMTIYPDEERAVLSPAYWFCVLASILMELFLPEGNTGESIRLEIASGIGSVVRCMCNDVKRQFFLSEKHWFLSAVRMLEVIDRVSCAQEREVIEELLGHQDGMLMTFLIQAFFWRSHRKDIVQKSRSYQMPLTYFDNIEGRALNILFDIVAALDEGSAGVLYFSERGVDLIKQMATTYIVNQEYEDSADETQFVFALLDILKSKDFIKKTSKEKSAHQTLLDSIVVSGCIDDKVIQEVISIAATTTDEELATEMINTCFDMLCVRTGLELEGSGHEAKVDDWKFACGINKGLIEMTLKVLARHGGSADSAQPHSNQLLTSNGIHFALDNLLDSVKTVANLRKSSSALRYRHDKITESLKIFEPIIPKNENCQNALHTIESILAAVPSRKADDVEKITCLRCDKELFGDDILCCGKCKKANYCSRDCQVEDWKCHKFYCTTISNNAQMIKLDGGSKKDVKKYLSHLENVEEAGRKVMLEKIEKILVQAIILRYDIMDCVAVLDLDANMQPKYGHSMIVMNTPGFLELYGKRLPDDLSNAKRLIANHREMGRLVCAYKTADAIALGYLDKSLAPSTSWSDAMDELQVKFDKFGNFGFLQLCTHMIPSKGLAAEYAEKVVVLEDRVVMIQPSRPEKENLGPNTFRRPSQAGENGEQCVLS